MFLCLPLLLVFLLTYLWWLSLQGRKPRSVEDLEKMDIIADSPTFSSEGPPESLQVCRRLVVIVCD